MLAGFSIVAQLVHDLGDFTALQAMMSLSEDVFQLTDEVLETVVDLRADVTPQFLPPTIRTLVTEDPELSYLVPFRMYWYYLFVQMVRMVSGNEEWRIDQHLSNANHYCGDTHRDGKFAFICWLLYGLSLYDCSQYATAQLILKLDYIAPTADNTSVRPKEQEASCR